jgi:mannitol 2-dehydrogenase
METGARVDANDPQWDRLRATADAARARPGAWLEMADIYGDLGLNEAFAKDFREELLHIWSHGTASALSRFASAGGGG